MEQRDSFVFYRSFYEAVSNLKPKDQTEVLLAVCEYALNGTEQKLSGVPAAIFLLIKPNLDANQKKYENGRKGGRPKTKPKPKANQTVTESEPNVLWVMGNELCVMGNEDGDVKKPTTALSEVMTAYLDKINPNASPVSLDELKGYVEQMGADCCMRAINIALDEKKTSWSYIRAILRSKLSQGVKCIADWDALEGSRRQNDPHSSGKSWEELAAEMDAEDGVL